jgi:hypothetical protein
MCGEEFCDLSNGRCIHSLRFSSLIMDRDIAKYYCKYLTIVIVDAAGFVSRPSYDVP